jgi:microcystin-dependent protein
MSDLPQQNTIVQYLADGVSTEYLVPFYTPLETDGTPDLDVFTQLSTADPVPESDIKIWGTDYTYTPYSDPLTGGYITFLPGKIPPSGYAVTIARDVQASLNVEFVNATTFSGRTLDAALDKLLLITQQNKSYSLGRNLSYIVNSYLPDATIAANVQIPVLADGQTWFGSSGGVIAATLEQPADVSTLRSELANEQPVTNGAALVGYYDDVNMAPTTVAAQLTLLTNAVVAPFPTGSLVDFAGTSAPAGFLPCDGAAVSRATYSDLFGVIGETWGIGDGTTTFNVPDFSRRVAMGSGGTGTAVIGNSVGDVSSDETEALTTDTQLPAHTHTASTTTSTTVPQTNAVGGNLNATVYGGTITGYVVQAGVSSTTIGSTGSGDSFNIVQASAVVLKIIKT